MDCFDTCQATLINGKVKASKEHKVTNGKLCVNFAYLLKQEKLEQAFFENKEISLEESLNILTKKLKNTKSSSVLYYKGSGNLGVMQNAPKVFFGQYGATFTKGSLCEGAGAGGIEKGRGFNTNPPLQNLLDSDIILVWGRNLSITSPHMYELIKDKTFITIDPIKTPIAKKSKVHLQINPKTDHDLALLMTRFAHMNDMEDEKNSTSWNQGAEYFLDLAKSKPLMSYEKTTGVNLQDVQKAIDLMKDKKVSILMGLGFQKYYEGVQITRTIDSFAAYIGLHNKKVGGVWYLENTSYSYDNQFEIKIQKEVDMVEVDFASYSIVFIQGANPVVSAPNTQRLINALKKTFVVYFGTTHNDTCKWANLIIPSSNFLAKKDIRLSYGHDLKAISNIVQSPHKNTISEYGLSQYLLKEFNLAPLKKEDDIISYYKNTKVEVEEIKTFEFIDELDIKELYEEKTKNNYYFLTSKQKHTLNSQFLVDDCLYINPVNSFKDKDNVLVTSPYGSAKFTIKCDENIKKNCIVVYAGAKNANYLTPLNSDEFTNSAIFQDILVSIELLSTS